MPAFGYPFVDMFVIMFVSGLERPKSEFFVFWKGLMGGGRIGKDNGMLLLLVLKVIVNAFLLQHSADEIEVGLPILHAIFPLRVVTGKLEFEITETTPPEKI